MVKIEMPRAVQDAWMPNMLEADFAPRLDAWLACHGARWSIVSGYPDDKKRNYWLGHYHFLEFEDHQRAVEFILKYG